MDSSDGKGKGKESVPKNGDGGCRKLRKKGRVEVCK